MTARVIPVKLPLSTHHHPSVFAEVADALQRRQGTWCDAPSSSSCSGSSISSGSNTSCSIGLV